LLSAADVQHLLKAVTRFLGDAVELVDDIRDQVPPLVQTVGSMAEVATAAFDTASQTLDKVEQMEHLLERQVRPLAGSTEKTMEMMRTPLGTVADALQPALPQVEKAFATAACLMQPDSPLLYDLRQALQALEQAARATRGLADYLQRHPEALFYGKGR
jgi:paraquat-inducible protein B